MVRMGTSKATHTILGRAERVDSSSVQIFQVGVNYEQLAVSFNVGTQSEYYQSIWGIATPLEDGVDSEYLGLRNFGVNKNM